MFNSKWNYVLAGITVMLTLISAASHDVLWTVANFALTAANWFGAERKRRLEEEALLMEKPNE